MLFVQLTPTRDSTSELLDALRHREVAVFGHIIINLMVLRTVVPSALHGLDNRRLTIPDYLAPS